MYGMIGDSAPMRALFALIDRIARTNTTVLVQGESGTGKELIAKALHRRSSRAGKALIPVNCGAIPEELLESELFGHVKGSFTGAAYTRPGRFELADGGTLFLDEIGDMSPKLQVKMLRVLQEKVFEPVGSVKSLKVDVRVIAATHKDLEKEVEEGRFREDLFYRLNVVPLNVPPLRDRIGDIPLLVRYFLKKWAEERELPELRVVDEIMAIFCRYRWNGNVRELENLMERLTILVDDEVALTDLPSKLVNGDMVTPSLPVPASAFSVSGFAEAGVDFNREVESYENQLIVAALEQTSWNKNKAARLLHLNRTTLVEKIKKKGLER